MVMPGVHMSEQIKKNGPDVGATSEKVHANRCRCRFCLKLFERMINLLPIYYQSIQNKSKTSCAPVGRSNSLRCLSQAPSIAKLLRSASRCTRSDLVLCICPIRTFGAAQGNCSLQAEGLFGCLSGSVTPLHSLIFSQTVAFIYESPCDSV